MALSFAELRKNRGSQLQKLNSELEKLNNNFSKTDDRFWTPTVDKAGNGYAVLRFLPAAEGEDVPFIRRWDHGFKGPGGKWYIELSRNSLGEDDPTSDMNSKLWAQGENSVGRRTVSGSDDMPGTKRRLHYIASVYIVEDPDKPENNGTVRLFKFGKKIFDKLNDAMNPKFKDEQALNPFDLWEGANFKLKIRKFEGHRNYDKSEFDRTTVGPLAGKTDTQLEEIWKSQVKLQTFLDPSLFKPYDELQKKLNSVMDITGTPATRADRETPPREEAPKVKEAEARTPTAEKGTNAGPADDENDETLSFFQRMAND